MNEDLWLSLHNGGVEEGVQNPGHTLRQPLVLLCPVITVNSQWQQSQFNQEKANMGSDCSGRELRSQMSPSPSAWDPVHPNFSHGMGESRMSDGHER